MSLPVQNEKQRLEVLWQYEVLDSAPEKALDDLTELAAEICECPIATITFVDQKRQWFKSKVGLTASETSRDISFCSHTILKNELMEIPDATKDSRFASNPLVLGEPNIRFYAGVPLINSEGYALGTICVIDDKPKTLMPSQRRALGVLGRHVMSLLELRRKSGEVSNAVNKLELADAKFRQLFENATEGIFKSAPDGRYLSANPEQARIFGYDSPREMLDSITNISEQLYVNPKDRQAFRKWIDQHGFIRDFQAHLYKKDRTKIWVRTNAQVVRDESGKILFYQGTNRDVTAEVEAQEQLREREEMFQLISQNMTDLIAVIDAQGRRLYSSPSYRRIFGLELQKGTDSFQQVHPEDVAAVRAVFRNTLETGVGQRIEYRFLLPDGSVRHIESQGNFVKGDSKESSRVLVVSRDISARKKIAQREAALSKLGRNLSVALSPVEAARIIAESTNELFRRDVFALNLYSPEKDEFLPLLNIDTVEGKVTEVSDSVRFTPLGALARRIIQGGAELILKKPPLKMLSETSPLGDISRPSASLMFAPVHSGTEVVGILSIQSYSLNAYDKEDLHFLKTIADHCGGALHRIRAEEALRMSEVRFHSVWENSVDGMRLTDQEGKIVAVNKAFCGLVGLPRERLEGQPFTVTYSDSNKHADLLKKYQQRFRDRSIERYIERKVTFLSGKTCELEGSNSFVDMDASRPLLLGLFRDVTEQRRLETQLRQSQKMDSIGQLAGGIAHDFNNLLTVIQGHTSLLLAAEKNASTNEALTEISLAAEQSAQLTRQLLTFSRRQIIQKQSLDLKVVVEQMTKMLRRILGEDILLKVKTSADLPLIHADRGMMEQVLLNLVVNSRDAMPRGGELVIATNPIRLDETYTERNPESRVGEFVCLQVTDNGTGISPENIGRIFEPFFTTKEMGKGTGLGLAIVYGIVKQHDGWIKVSSEPGKGTSFEIFLPRDLEPKTIPAAAQEKKVPRGSETILLVEDERPLRQLVQYILERQGYRVLEADSGVSALKVWQQQQASIDLLLTDLIMPEGLSGTELAASLLTENPRLKVIYTSGYSADIVGKDFVLKEGLNFLQKPYHPDKLAQAVRDCLDGK
ncbi:MAG: PAS domain S-box protein [Verrucomicrobiota bacterium]